MKIDLVISRNINGTPIVQRCMKNRDCIIFCHIDLIKDSKSAIFCTPVNASLSKLYFIILKSVRTNQIPTVCIDVKRNIIRRPVKYICQIFCQNIFAGGFWSGQKQILSLQDPCNGHLQNIFSIKWNCRFDNSVFHLIRNGIYFPKLYNFIY